ncbi:MAG: putative toxin-antitoxin system toxin component, PIN family [Burkholderiales bacterium]|nr:MAG: putative toxin-antitoxin system toxin component, PIN family [Burkholderiales bacterium]
MPIVVLDTNIVLDIFLFTDPRTSALREALGSGQIVWLATPHMRNELERVLAYTHIEAKLAFYEKTAEGILAAFDQAAQITEPPSTKAPYTCKDPDDQAFIDLACHLASRKPGSPIHLISKDKAVLSMRKRLEKLAVIVRSTIMA